MLIISKWENPDYFFFYLDGIPDHSQYLMGSKLDQDQEEPQPAGSVK